MWRSPNERTHRVARHSLMALTICAWLHGVIAMQGAVVSESLSASWEGKIVTAGDYNLPQYRTPPGSGYDGVAAIRIVTTNGAFLCSGSLLRSGRDILTAGHCLAGSGSLDVISSTAYFFSPEGRLETYAGTHYTLHPEFSSDLRAGNDVGLVRLSEPVNPSIQRYRLYTDNDELGQVYDIAGFGRLGTGQAGQSTTSGNRRHGFNFFDSTIEGTLSRLSGWAGGSRVLMSDFDSGFSYNDGFGFFFGLNNLGLGSSEVNIAGGDSGGPAFIDGKVAGVVSFGARVTFANGVTSDVDSSMNSSFGEFAGFTRVSSYADFIDGATIPEPSTYALLASGVVAFILARKRVRLQRS